MNIISKNTDNSTYIGFQGELDEQTASEIKVKLNEILSDAKQRVVFDLTNLDFMDSTGIGVLIGIYKKFRNKNYSFFLSGANSTLNKILTLSGIYSIMPKLDF